MELWPLPLTNVTGVAHIADAWPQRHLPVVVAVTSVSKEVCLVCSAPSFHTAIAEHSKSLKESIFCPLLPPQIDGSTLRTLCLQHGPLITFHLNLTQGNAVVRYSSKEEAAKAQKSLHMYVFSSVPSLLSSHQCPVLLGGGASVVAPPPHCCTGGALGRTPSFPSPDLGNPRSKKYGQT